MFHGITCPLCGSGDCREVGRDKRRIFLICDTCTLIFIPHAYQLSRDAEKMRYDLHDNTLSNSGYVAFLSEVAACAESLLPPEARILDYGCGKEGVLTELLRRAGRQCDPWDPLYEYVSLDDGAPYDMVILCEVIEHCRDLRWTLEHIAGLLKKEGMVLVRTRCYPETGVLTTWWYAQDLTHVCFFSRRALETVANVLGKKQENTVKDDIFLFR